MPFSPARVKTTDTAQFLYPGTRRHPAGFPGNPPAPRMAWILLGTAASLETSTIGGNVELRRPGITAAPWNDARPPSAAIREVPADVDPGIPAGRPTRPGDQSLPGRGRQRVRPCCGLRGHRPAYRARPGRRTVACGTHRHPGRTTLAGGTARTRRFIPRRLSVAGGTRRPGPFRLQAGPCFTAGSPVRGTGHAAAVGPRPHAGELPDRFPGSGRLSAPPAGYAVGRWRLRSPSRRSRVEDRPVPGAAALRARHRRARPARVPDAPAQGDGRCQRAGAPAGNGHRGRAPAPARTQRLGRTAAYP